MKVLFTATVVKTHINEFHLPYLKLFKEHGWETSVAARNDFDDPSDCVIPHCDNYYPIPFERNPLHPGNIKAYKMLKELINNGDYDIIHCHTPVGGLLTRLAARKARKKGCRVFYTAHGFHFYKGAPLVNWLVYYPVERFLAHFTDVLITINKEDYQRAKKFRSDRVEYIPGVGIDIEKFMCTEEERAGIRQSVRKELGIPMDATVLLSVGEVNKNKNHRLVIECLPELGEDLRYVICGRGPLMERHRTLAETLGVSDRLIMTGYRTDVADLYKMADVFVFPSLREGLPVALMEAMSSGLPVICTRIRGNTDLVENGVSGEIVEGTSQSLTAAVHKLCDNAAIMERYSGNAENTARAFQLGAILSEMRGIYGIAEK